MVKKDKLTSLNAAYSIIEKELVPIFNKALKADDDWTFLCWVKKDKKKHIYVDGIELRKGVAYRKSYRPESLCADEQGKLSRGQWLAEGRSTPPQNGGRNENTTYLIHINR